jgi:hypothetical protein
MEKNHRNISPITGVNNKKEWTTPQVKGYEIPETEATFSGDGSDYGFYSS